MNSRRFLFFIFAVVLLHVFPIQIARSFANDRPIKVFIFAGQSNMVGSDSRVEDIKLFPPYVGLEKPQSGVLFSYCIGREKKSKSDGWVELQPVNNIVGPELSFARMVSDQVDEPIAIIKVAAGGTHLGGDWNPDEPAGFKMYPLALQWVQNSVKELSEQGYQPQIEAFFWHQGENDMFNPEYMNNYGKNLKNFLASWRRDLKSPELPFFIGELCTKTIWGMDLRPRMYAISLGQKEVAKNDPLATYVPTSHVGVEIGSGVGLHYHYGTLGQLQHGENYANAYLAKIGKKKPRVIHRLPKWPYPKGSPIDLYVLAGHRNMEGERAFIQQLGSLEKSKHLLRPNPDIAFKYDVGGGYQKSDGWIALGPTGYYQTFGPELSFAEGLVKAGKRSFAISKFTHSGSQIIDWTPEGSVAKTRMIYKRWIEFINESIEEIQSKGNNIRKICIVYHVGENDMSFYPYRKDAAKRVHSLIVQTRKDLGRPDLQWIVSQQPPTDDKRVNQIDVISLVGEVLANDPHTVHLKHEGLPPQEKKLVLNTQGVLFLGSQIAKQVIESGF